MLATREDTHPAIVDLLMIASAEIFGGHTLLADAGEFPSPENVDIELNEGAERYFQHGAPFLMRYLPFWAATLVDRLVGPIAAIDRLVNPIVQIAAAAVPLAHSSQDSAALLETARDRSAI